MKALAYHQCGTDAIPSLMSFAAWVWVRLGAGMAQWREHSPPIDGARDRFSDSTQFVGWVCCWFSSLLREVFLRVLRFSPLLKNQHFQILIRSRIQWTKSHSVEVPLQIPIIIIITFVGSLLYSKRFFPGYSGFLLSSKSKIWIWVDLL